MSFQTMNEAAEKLKSLVDDYWKLKVSEKEFIHEISDVFSNTDNRGLIMRGFSFKAGFERILGKKRLEEVKKALIKVDKDLYSGLLEQ